MNMMKLITIIKITKITQIDIIGIILLKFNLNTLAMFIYKKFFFVCV